MNKGYFDPPRTATIRKVDWQPKPTSHRTFMLPTARKAQAS